MNQKLECHLEIMLMMFIEDIFLFLHVWSANVYNIYSYLFLHELPLLVYIKNTQNFMKLFFLTLGFVL